MASSDKSLAIEALSVTSPAGSGSEPPRGRAYGYGKKKLSIDTTPPSMVSAVVATDGLSIVITYSEDVAGTLESGDWDFLVDGGAYSGSITGVTINSGNAREVTLALSSAILQGATVSDLDYQASNETANSVTDTALNPAVTQTLIPITNGSTATLTGDTAAPLVGYLDPLSTGLIGSLFVLSNENGTIQIGGQSVSGALTETPSGYLPSPYTYAANLQAQSVIVSGSLTVTDLALNTGTSNPDLIFTLGTSGVDDRSKMVGNYVLGFGGDDFLSSSEPLSSSVPYNFLNGGAGDDDIEISTDSNLIISGEGFDLISFSGAHSGASFVSQVTGAPNNIFVVDTGLVTMFEDPSTVLSGADYLAVVQPLTGANVDASAMLSGLIFDVAPRGSTLTGGAGNDLFMIGGYASAGTPDVITGGAGANVYAIQNTFDTLIGSSAINAKITDLKIGDVFRLESGYSYAVNFDVASGFAAEGLSLDSTSGVKDIILARVNNEYYLGIEKGDGGANNSFDYIGIGSSLPEGVPNLGYWSLSGNDLIVANT